jgi:DNA invertase Pin-like site-specific DNA recombinase
MRQPVAHSYVRFSSKPQERGESTRRQIERAEAWSARSGIPLSKSKTLNDLGVSAFKGLNWDVGALGEFKESIGKSDEVLPGDYLVVENLDRMSRQEVRKAFAKINELIDAGIKIVQLTPTEMIYDQDADTVALIIMIVELSRANSESVRKSDLVGDVREEDRKKERDEKEVGRFALPPWLGVAVVEGKRKPVLNDKAPLYRSLFAMAVDGKGLKDVARESGISRTNVRRILADRSAIGEATRYKGRGKGRVPVQTVPGLYPELVDPATFHAAGQVLTPRKLKHRRRSGRFPNPFQGLLRDARTGASYVVQYRKEKNGRRHHVIQVADTGKWSFPFEVIEDALLTMIREIKTSEVTGGHDPDELQGLKGERDFVRGEVEQIKADLGRRYSVGLSDVLHQREQQLAQLEVAVEDAERKARTPASATLGQVQTLLDAYRAAEDKAEACARLRAAMRRCFSAIYVFVCSRGMERFADVQVNFRDSDIVRHVAIYVRPPRGYKPFSKEGDPPRDVVIKPGLWWALGRKSFVRGDRGDLSQLSPERAEAEAGEFIEWVDLAMPHSMREDSDLATGPTAWGDARGRAVWGEIPVPQQPAD